jgi:hypothetical protein
MLVHTAELGLTDAHSSTQHTARVVHSLALHEIDMHNIAKKCGAYPLAQSRGPSTNATSSMPLTCLGITILFSLEALPRSFHGIA